MHKKNLCSVNRVFFPFKCWQHQSLAVQSWLSSHIKGKCILLQICIAWSLILYRGSNLSLTNSPRYWDILWGGPVWSRAPFSSNLETWVQGNMLVYSPQACGRPRMLSLDYRESSFRFCLSSYLPCQCGNNEELAELIGPPLHRRPHLSKSPHRLTMTHFACASACMKMNSHFRANALCSLARLSWKT